MKQCIALAGLACLLVSGCAQNQLFAGKNGCPACHVATSQGAPRPEILRTACRPGCDSYEASLGGRMADFRGRANVGCEFDESCYPCSCDCGDSCGDACGECQGRSCRLIDKLASGGCGLRGGGCGAGGCGLSNCNPHAGGYPEATSFNPGQPTGQVAYPYYTVRGPRDFLMKSPPSIGPY